MKTILAISITALCCGAAVMAADIQAVHVGLSPFYLEADRGCVWTQLVGWVSKVPAQTRIVFGNAWDLQTIVSFEVPRLRYETPKAKAAILRPHMAKLKSWFDYCAKDIAPSALRGSAGLRIPEYIDQVAAQAGVQTYSIVLIGSPLYQSLTEPVFSFHGDAFPWDRFPSDANLACDQAGSVFGIVGKQQRLSDVTLHWWYPREGLFSSLLYKDRVERFWNLWITHQTGTLASFSADGTAILRVATLPGLPPKRQDAIDPRQNKVEMLSLARDMPVSVITNRVGTVAFRFATPTNAPSAQFAAFRTTLENAVPADKTVIGIMWSIGGLDLDLYVWHHPGAQPLYFGNTRTPEGRYNHDYTDSNDQLDYEYVILDAPADLRQVQVAVNFFQGQTLGDVRGKFLVCHKGRAYEGSFSLAAHAGNHGEQIESRSSSPFWTEIKLTAMVDGREPSNASR